MPQGRGPFPKLHGCLILSFCAVVLKFQAQTIRRVNRVGVERLFGKSKRIVVLAADHRYFGVVAGLEKTRAVLAPLLHYVDVLMTDPGGGGPGLPAGARQVRLSTAHWKGL